MITNQINQIRQEDLQDEIHDAKLDIAVKIINDVLNNFSESDRLCILGELVALKFISKQL